MTMTMTTEQMTQYCREEKYLDEYIRVLYAKEGCPECIDKLWKQYVNMVRDYVRKHYKTTMYFEIEELTNQCYFYFLDALRKFDIDTGNKFGTFLRANLQQLSRYVIQQDSTVTRPADYSTKLKRDETTILSSMSMDTLRKDDGTSFAETYEEVGADNAVTAPLDRSLLSDYIEDLLGILTPMHRDVIVKRLIDDKSVSAICKELGITENQYSKQYKLAMYHLRSKASRNRIKELLTNIDSED